MKIRFLKTVTSPAYLAGVAGEVKQLLPEHMQLLVESGYAEEVRSEPLAEGTVVAEGLAMPLKRNHAKKRTRATGAWAK